MLVERLRKEWRARETGSGLNEALCFKSEGLVLGAGTVLVRGEHGAGDEERLKALLSVAYGKPIAGQAIGHVKAAAIRWREGETARASLHLALSRLAPLENPTDTARRLFMADGLMRAGVQPQTILEALDVEASAKDIAKKYNPDQPRVPAGSGRASGEWTSGGGGTQTPSTFANNPAANSATVSRDGVQGVGRAGLTLLNFTFPTATAGHPAPGLDLAGMSMAALSRLAAFLAGLGETGALTSTVTATGAVAVLGVLFIPSTGPKGKWVEVGGRGDLSYYVNPDEAVLRLKYTTPDGVQHVFAASPDPGGDYRGPTGNVIARLVKAGAKTGLVVSTAELVGDDSDEPKACPAAVKDNGGERGADYEDFAKALFNPANPTPRKMAYAFFNPKTGQYVKIDDCQQQSGALAEYKGPNFEEHYLKNDGPWQGMLSGMLKQSADQLASKGNRSLTWYFAEKSVADKMRDLFDTEGTERPGIDVKWLPWPGTPTGRQK